jgi:hypothetical protein
MWRGIERIAFRDDPIYFLNIASSTGEKEFFVLSVDGDYVGRASATINKGSITPQQEETGFIEDFVVLKQYAGDADLLISCCLSSLRGRGARQVIARGGGMLPAIQTEGYEHYPPFGCPHNPPWYVDIFLSKGFLKTDEWTFFNSKLPQIPPSGGREFEQTCRRLGIKLRPLNIKNPRESMEFQYLMTETNPSSFRFNPVLSQNISHFKAFIFHIVYRLFKAKVFIGVDKGGRMVFCVSYIPDLNLAIKSSHIDMSRKRLSNAYPFLKFPFIIRRTKVCRELGVGLEIPISSPSYFSSYLKACHQIGIEPVEGGEYINMENIGIYWCYLMRRDGYEEINAAVQTSNLSAQYLQGFIQKYENITPIGKYATLTYNF